MSSFNDTIIEEFRSNGGKVAQFGDAPMVILHTTGAKSGEPRDIPLVAFVDGGELYVFASKAGAPTQPDWLHNLRAHPDITVEYGTEAFKARAVELDEDDRKSKLDAQIAVMPTFGEYVTKAAPRVIPVVQLQRV